MVLFSFFYLVCVSKLIVYFPAEKKRKNKRRANSLSTWYTMMAALFVCYSISLMQFKTASMGKKSNRRKASTSYELTGQNWVKNFFKHLIYPLPNMAKPPTNVYSIRAQRVP